MFHTRSSTIIGSTHAICGMSSYRRLGMVVPILLLVISVVMTGCDSQKASAPANKPARVRNRIIAQGQILPADGLIRLAASPGDTIDEIHVKVDDVVEAGQSLITMRSLKLRKNQLEAIQKRYEDAQMQQDVAVDAAKQRVEAAELKLKQVDAQRSSLKRQEELLALAKQQVTATQAIHQQLKSIANDPLTKDYIGSVELNRQQIAVSDAELKFGQESEKLKQASESIEWSERAAKQELQAARSAQNAADSSLALQAIQSEMDSIKLQSDASILKAPRTARVIAINGRVGEVAAQLPLIELADDSHLVCVVEVPETDASLIKPDQVAILKSPALGELKLNGKVLRRERIVGRPALPSIDPLAISDYRSTNVIIAIDPADTAEASHWLQLQVTVEIQIDHSAANSSGAAKTPMPGPP
jgi:HlyD family secretion protein